jgi:outer membrane protein OmpA-like peptidoglycan-associated protein
MLMKRISALLVVLAVCGGAVARAQGVQITAPRTDATVTVEQAVSEGKAMVRVTDAKKEPVLNLTSRDFAVSRAGEAGRIVSVEPVSKSVDVARHVVLVLDNSFSIVERRGVGPLLDAATAVVKTIRPIDDVRMIVFSERKATKLGTRSYPVDVLSSNKPAELEQFARAAYTKKTVTDVTVLYDAMAAGLEILKGMPADHPRFLWVFSDGEDLNSAIKADALSQAAQGVPSFRAFLVDTMPGPQVDGYFGKFAGQNRGEVRKVAKASELLPLFQQAGTMTTHGYVVSYEFPPPSRVAVEAVPPPAAPQPGPKTVFYGATLFDFNKADIKPEGREQLKAYRDQARDQLSRADKIKLTGHTDNIGSAAYNQKLSLRRANAVRDYLASLGVDKAKMEVRGEGLRKPVADNKTEEGRAKNRRVEIELEGVGK